MKKKTWITPEINEVDIENTQGGIGSNPPAENTTYSS